MAIRQLIPDVDHSQACEAIRIAAGGEGCRATSAQLDLAVVLLADQILTMVKAKDLRATGANEEGQ